VLFLSCVCVGVGGVVLCRCVCVCPVKMFTFSGDGPVRDGWQPQGLPGRVPVIYVT